VYLHKTPAIASKLFPNMRWSVPTKHNEIFLTFDDGPIPELTPWVLDVLDEFDAKATFFCVGENVKKYRTIAADLFARGHVIGNHTQHHLNGARTKTNTYLNDVKKCQNTINGIAPVQPKLFRPPYGKFKTSQMRILRQEFNIIMWSVLSGDFDLKLSPEKCLSKTISASKAGSIVVFHDNVKAEKNLRVALPGFLQHFKSLGFKFKAL